MGDQRGPFGGASFVGMRKHARSCRACGAIRSHNSFQFTGEGRSRMIGNFRPALAELVGTFVFFFIGAGSIITDSYTHGAVGLIGVALAHGLILSIMVSTF